MAETSRSCHFANQPARNRNRATVFWRAAVFAWIGSVLATSAIAATPAAVQSLQALRDVAMRTVRAAAPPDASLTATAGRLDPRLRLPACTGTLSAARPNLLATTSVVLVPVTCTGAAGWTIRVPVEVQLLRKVLVATQAIGRGTTLTPGEFTSTPRNVATLGYGYLMSPDTAIGRVTRVQIMPGAVITPSMLAPQEAVRSGQSVSIVARIGTIAVRAAGLAMAGGRPGELIQVKSLGCKCMIQGVIQADGTVLATP